MNTKIVQKCGCYEGDCVEILGLEVPLYACFTCGYAGITPSGADNPHEDEVHVHDLLAEVKRRRAENEELRAAFGQRLRDLVGDFLKNEGRKRYR